MPNKSGSSLEVVSGARGRPPLAEGAPAGEAELSLAQVLDRLSSGRWIIVGAACLALIAGALYAFLASPVFRTDVLIQVEQANHSSAVLDDLSALMGDTSAAETEIEILRSRAMVGAVVDELRLDIAAVPRRFPIFGAAWSRFQGRTPGLAGAPLGLIRYAWGGERIRLGRLEVPAEWVAQPLTVASRGDGRYALLNPDGETVLEGAVGRPAEGHGASIFVAELVARPGTEFTVTRFDRGVVIAELQQDLRIAEVGKKTGIIRVALEGHDRAQLAATLDALSRAYLRQNVERKSEEAAKTLVFLESQIPVVKANLSAAEAELQRYQARRKSVDVTIETQAAVQRSADVEKAIGELQIEEAELLQRFTPKHPSLMAVQEKLARLRSQRAGAEERMKKLPEDELESARRMRDVKVANDLYLTLLNKAEELRVVKSGTIGNVRILDAAVVPSKPVWPRKALTLALSLVLGLALGVGGAFLKAALDHGIEDPEELEQDTGLAVYASVPHSAKQAQANHRRARGQPFPLLAQVEPADLAVESLRSLRTSLEFALLEAKNNLLTIGGPAPGVGKSFIAANLAYLLAEGGRRVAVVDVDLRRGRLHRYFGLERTGGLSDVLRGAVSLEAALRPTVSPNLSFLSTGELPPNAAELLSSERLQKVLDELSKRVDLVIMDLPPILAVTDGALVARHAGVNLMVLKAGQHPLREISAALRLLARNGVEPKGFILNNVALDRGLGRRSAYHYQYSYK